MLKILWKRREIAPEEQFLLLSTIFSYLMLDFYVKTRIRFSLLDKAVIRDNRNQDNEGRLYIMLSCQGFHGDYFAKEYKATEHLYSFVFFFFLQLSASIILFKYNAMHFC